MVILVILSICDFTSFLHMLKTEFLIQLYNHSIKFKGGL